MRIQVEVIHFLIVTTTQGTFSFGESVLLLDSDSKVWDIGEFLEINVTKTEAIGVSI